MVPHRLFVPKDVREAFGTMLSTPTFGTFEMTTEQGVDEILRASRAPVMVNRSTEVLVLVMSPKTCGRQ